jgi:hypothetical protein
MRCLLRSTLILLASAAAVSGDDASNAMDAHVQDMVAWLRNQGGHFNEKLQIRRADPSDPTSYYGVFATESIQSMEPLMNIPASSMIRTNIPPDYFSSEGEEAVLCDLTHVLLKELKLGEKSHFAPFVKYLLGQERGQIPATWTEPAKELLREVAYRNDLTDWIQTDFEQECIGPGNAFEQQALAMVIQRGWDSVLIPIYDMVNHVSNPEKLNTDNNSVYRADGLNVWASRAIEPGEEILASYDNCNDCDIIAEYWGTQELLRDFGFVEQYPRKFYLGEDTLVAIDMTVELDGETAMMHIDWRGYDSPSYEEIESMKEEYQRLQNLEHGGTLAERRHLMPEKEWNTIFQYHQALATALKYAILVAIDDLENAAEDDDLEDEVDGTFDNIDDLEKKSTDEL